MWVGKCFSGITSPGHSHTEVHKKADVVVVVSTNKICGGNFVYNKSVSDYQLSQLLRSVKVWNLSLNTPNPRYFADP